MKDWHTLSIKDVIKELKTNEEGLGQKEAGHRLKKFGHNEFEKVKRPGILEILSSQLKSFLVLILFIAIAISLMIGHLTDAIVILTILIINTSLGFYQEYKAEKTIESLEMLTVPRTRVLRDGKQSELNSRLLVPGDVIILEEGNRIPADARLIEIVSLKMDESMLTGESTSIAKLTKKIKHVPLADRENMVYMGTTVSYGRGKAVIVATGMNTEMGKIAGIIQEKKEITPLQKKLDEFGKWLGFIALLVAGFVLFLGVLEGEDFYEMLLTTIALAVSAIPEGLLAVVTITLALGVKRMSKRNALVRKLSAVETLGSVSVICADKTGTMTTNEMTVREIWYNDESIRVSGIGFKPAGSLFHGKKKIWPKNNPNIEKILKIGLYCNNASLLSPIPIIRPDWSVAGDPTEGALLVAAEKGGMKKHGKRIGEIPFSSERKRMSVIHQTHEGMVVYAKGAPEIILNLCNRIQENKRIRKLGGDDRKRILQQIEKMTSDGLRVLGMAYKRVKKSYKKKKVEDGLIFNGLVGMIDPPRKEVKKAIQECKQAGIRVVMITGDHELTAIAVAKDLGLISFDSKTVLNGSQIDELTDKELEGIVENISVYARTSAEHKVRILQALKRKGHVVAMTGDGVNDAPAIKKADIGVAMGVRGTDVTKEASDMILTDDNFASIVDAVKEGRGVYDNIRKFIRFLLSANFDEILETSIAVLAGLPIPFLPINILWINLITDGLPALALSVDPKEPDIMKRKPRDPKRGIMSGMLLFIIVAALLDCFSSLTLFIWELNSTGSLVKARTMAFTAAIFFELFFVFNCRSEKHSIFKTNLLSNKKLIIAVIASILLQIAVIYIPFLQPVFGTVGLDMIDWVKIIIFSSLGIFILPEIFIRGV